MELAYFMRESDVSSPWALLLPELSSWGSRLLWFEWWRQVPAPGNEVRKAVKRVMTGPQAGGWGPSRSEGSRSLGRRQAEGGGTQEDDAS